MQEQVRAWEARDRNIAESNFARVNHWSMLQIAVMLIVGVIQVSMRNKIKLQTVEYTQRPETGEFLVRMQKTTSMSVMSPR